MDLEEVQHCKQRTSAVLNEPFDQQPKSIFSKKKTKNFAEKHNKLQHNLVIHFGTYST